MFRLFEGQRADMGTRGLADRNEIGLQPRLEPHSASRSDRPRPVDPTLTACLRREKRSDRGHAVDYQRDERVTDGGIVSRAAFIAAHDGGDNEGDDAYDPRNDPLAGGNLEVIALS
jgi:hypothetical protein